MNIDVSLAKLQSLMKGRSIQYDTSDLITNEGKWTKWQRLIYNTLHRKLKIEEYEPSKKPGSFCIRFSSLNLSSHYVIMHFERLAVALLNFFLLLLNKNKLTILSELAQENWKHLKLFSHFI
jgi:hypothetical protein